MGSRSPKFEDTEWYEALLYLMYFANGLTFFLILFALFLLTLPQSSV